MSYFHPLKKTALIEPESSLTITSSLRPALKPVTLFDMTSATTVTGLLLWLSWALGAVLVLSRYLLGMERSRSCGGCIPDAARAPARAGVIPVSETKFILIECYISIDK